MKQKVLAIDIGNTNIVFGMFEDGELAFTSRSSTDRKKTSDDYALTIKGIFSLYGRDIREISGAVMSSVVPQVSHAISSAVKKTSGINVLTVRPENCGIKILADRPECVGTDRIANSAAVWNYPRPVIVLDLGTATTVSVVDEEGAFIGGCICPGVMTSLEALSSVAAQLPRISIENPGPMIAKNTVDCMCGGIVYGTAAMLDGIVERMEKSLGKSATVVATGGLAPSIIRHCKRNVIYNANLLLEGLYRIYITNRSAGLEGDKTV